MSDIDVKNLHELIDKFIEKELGGDAFEKLYSGIFDFEDIDAANSDMGYFSSIREVLEHYSSSEEDLKGHSDYYISESQLRDKIAELRRSEGSQ
jgi:signal recognition particle GTPase